MKLVLNATDGIFTIGEFGYQQLQRQIARGPRIPDSIHLAHPARAQQPEYLEPSTQHIAIGQQAATHLTQRNTFFQPVDAIRILIQHHANVLGQRIMRTAFPFDQRVALRSRQFQRAGQQGLRTLPQLDGRGNRAS